jgi:hypothetical protein
VTATVSAATITDLILMSESHLNDHAPDSRATSIAVRAQPVSPIAFHARARHRRMIEGPRDRLRTR